MSLSMSKAGDHEAVTGGAWIYMSKGGNTQIRVVMGNRKSGCDLDGDHEGFTFHVN